MMSNASQQALNKREIRVFISSTFRDMQTERDYLAKFTFPRLRQLCESRGVTWSEVDLRWGVTDEQAAEGNVLPICLQEIDRCRPFFVGLLGERYGWIPESIPPEVIERQPWLKEHVEGKKSVTELEILHGVLRQPPKHERAFFYFRDPAYLESVSLELRQHFFSEDADADAKLRRLKELICAARDERICELRENYPTPEALGNLIFADLSTIINKLFPEGSQPDPLDRDAMEHEAFARTRERVYIGGQDYFNRLTAHIAGTDPRPLVILGDSGSGKTALMANWTARYRESNPDALVIQHFIGSTPQSADWVAMLRRFLGEFKRMFDIQQDIPEQPDALRSIFPNWLHLVAAKGRVVLVLDALNQLEDCDGAPDLVWLPPEIPKNVRLVISTLSGRTLNEITKRHWPTLRISPLSSEEQRQLIEDYLEQHSKSLSPARVNRIVAASQAANPLYLRILLDELRLVRTHEELEDRIQYYLEAPSPYELYEKVIDRWEQDYEGDTDLVGDALTLLWAARRGLSEAELLSALGCDGEPLPHAMWSPLFLAMSDSLVSRGGMLTFAHDFLRTAARDAYIPTENHQRAAHLRLAYYFGSEPATRRQLDELPWQLKEAAAWPQLFTLLSDVSFFDALWQADQFDAKICWARLEDNAFRMVDAYRPLLNNPGRFDSAKVWGISFLFANAGHPVEAFALYAHLVDHCCRTGDRAHLQASLGGQALILHARGDLDGAMELHKQQEQICRELGDKASLQVSLGNQAVILQTQGDLNGAMALNKQQEQICREEGNKDGLQRTLGNQGNILFAQRDLDGAMALHQLKEQICRELGNKDGLQVSLHNQAAILYTRGDLDGAMALHKQEEQIWRELGNQASLQASLGAQAVIMQAQGDVDAAMALLKQQEQICRVLGYKDGLSISLGNQANILFARGDLDRAMAVHKQEEQICRELNNKDGLQVCLGNQALILKARGDLARAMGLLKQQEQICCELGNKAVLQASLGNQALILKARGDLAGAIALHKQQTQICREVGDNEGLLRSLGDQALILRDCGDLDGAMALLKQQEQICRNLADKDSLQRTLGNQANIRHALNDLDGAMALAKQQEKICREIGNRDDLSLSLGGQAVILQTRGDLDGALALLRQNEQICREQGNKDGLSISLGNHAVILQNLGDLDGAMALHKQQEQLCRETGNARGLAISMANQANLLTRGMGRPQDALSLIEEACRLAHDHGLVALAHQIQPILDQVRSMVGRLR